MPANSELARDDIVALYRRLLEGWTVRDAAAFGANFAADGSTVGFDGSQMDGTAVHHAGDVVDAG